MDNLVKHEIPFQLIRGQSIIGIDKNIGDAEGYSFQGKGIGTTTQSTFNYEGRVVKGRLILNLADVTMANANLWAKNYRFADVEHGTGKVIADEGNEGFLAIENEVNATLEADESVIAPGGSAIYGKEAMEHFKEIGIIVYLKLSYEDLAKRLGNLKGRGVVLKEGQTLKDLYDERSKLYEQYAEITVDESGKDIQGTILALREQIGM